MTYDNKSYRVVAPATQSLYKRDKVSSPSLISIFLFLQGTHTDITLVRRLSSGPVR